MGCELSVERGISFRADGVLSFCNRMLPVRLPYRSRVVGNKLHCPRAQADCVSEQYRLVVCLARFPGGGGACGK